MKILLISLLAANLLLARIISVGMDLSYPPFEMSDKDNKPSGLSVDFVRAFAKENGYGLKIKNIAWDGLIPALRSKQIDMIISSMTITPQRARVLSFSKPYASSNLAILTKINSDIKSAKDLNGKVLALRRGALGHLWAVKNLPKSRLLLFDKEEMAVLEVLQGKADATLYDDLSVYKIWQKNKKSLKAIFGNFEQSPGYWGVGFNKDEKDLLIKMNVFIDKAQKNGLFDSLGDKYLYSVKKYFKANNIKFFFLN